MWARSAVLQWPSQTDLIHETYFRAGPYSHLFLHPIFSSETHTSVRWTYTFNDMGMQFVIDKAFFISNDGVVSGVKAANVDELARLVFDHYHAYVADLRHLHAVVGDGELMEE